MTLYVTRKTLEFNSLAPDNCMFLLLFKVITFQNILLLYEAGTRTPKQVLGIKTETE